jgi:hypothetical protein
MQQRSWAGKPARRPDPDDMTSIVVADLFAQGRPRRDGVPVVRFAGDGDIPTRVELVPFENGIECIYSQWVVDGRRPVEGRYLIHVTKTYPHFGGERFWFHCARESCLERSGRLFLHDVHFVCRECAGVRYKSQRHAKPRHVKRIERARAIRKRLSGRSSLGGPLPDRPKGMHRATYEPLRQELLEIERSEDERIKDAVQQDATPLPQLLLDEFERRARDQR